MKLEFAAEEDLEQILQLQKKSFYGQALIYNDFELPPLTQTIDNLRAEFKLKTFFKLERDHRIIASIRCYIEDNSLFIEKLIVDPDFQNRGIGTSVIREIENRYSHAVNKFALYTGDKSSRNLHIYKKLGYREIRREPTSHDFQLVFMEKTNEKK
ncbi:MAG: GNAT family N-acetyltransferase [Nitrospiraceae bacterium]|nr:GNAT family N-acetyltransferase [Nitrospiraceae bacterium]